MVRHQVLVLAFGGSNPSIPAIEKDRVFALSFSIIAVGIRAPGFA